MSFTQMKRDDLYMLATENFAVEVEQTATKGQIIAALAEEGVTWDMAKTFDENARAIEEAKTPVAVITADQTNPAPVVVTDTVVTAGPTAPVVTETVTVAPETVLVKMDRENGTYQVRGYRFTREHPIVIVRSDDADYIVENIDGFKIASPREVKEFYG